MKPTPRVEAHSKILPLRRWCLREIVAGTRPAAGQALIGRRRNVDDGVTMTDPRNPDQNRALASRESGRQRRPDGSRRRVCGWLGTASDRRKPLVRRTRFATRQFVTGTDRNVDRMAGRTASVDTPFRVRGTGRERRFLRRPGVGRPTAASDGMAGTTAATGKPLIRVSAATGKTLVGVSAATGKTLIGILTAAAAEAGATVAGVNGATAFVEKRNHCELLHSATPGDGIGSRVCSAETWAPDKMPFGRDSTPNL